MKQKISDTTVVIKRKKRGEASKREQRRKLALKDANLLFGKTG